MKLTHAIALASFVGLALTASASDGKAVWENSCAKCHGADGKGDTNMGKKLKILDLSSAQVQAGFKDEDAADAIKNGKKNQNGKVTMKPIEGLSDDDIKAVIAHLRTLKS